jgi:hypothetical protein
MPMALAPVVTYLAGVIGSYFVAEVIVYAVTELALNAVLRALAPRAPKPVDYPRTQSISDTLAHGKILYGMVCVGGTNIIPPISTTGTDPKDGKTYAGNWTHRGLALAQHEVDSFGPVRFEQSYIDQAQLSPITGTLDDGLVLASGNAWDNVLHQSRWAMVRCYRGTSADTADYILRQADPVAFTTQFRTRGVACLFATFGFGDIFSGGVPPISVCINGMKVYDPRKDSSNGGAGAHRYNLPGTWEWSNNPILCAANLIIFDKELGGGGYDPALDIDWPLASAAANLCDASVDTHPTVVSLVSQGGTITISGNTTTKTGGANNAWDSSARSTVAIRAGRISFRSATPTLLAMAGLTDIATGSASYTDIDYAWYPSGASGWSIYEFGGLIKNIPGAVQTTDIAEILYDGTNVLYLLNGKIIRQKKVPTQGMNLYFDSSFYSSGSSLVVNQQRRYTCNLELDGAALFEDNLGYLVDAAFGRAIDRDGKWRLYAGAWDSTTTTVARSDWIGPVDIQAVSPRREGRWNGVRAFYYDPLRNWQRVECQPRTNAAYRTADGGERIWQELDRPAINDESTAQRVAEFTLRQSRNGIKVSGTLGPKWQKLATWETVLIDYPELGWTGKAFRCMGYTLNSEGSVGVSFTEEQASDWTDMASAEFDLPDQHLIPVTNEQEPQAITSLVATPYSESILFSIGLPPLDAGSTVVFYEFPVQGTDPADPTRVYVGQTASDLFTLKKADSTSRYYRAWIRNRTGNYSLPYPPSGSNAIEGYAGSHALIGRGVFFNGDSAYKISTGLNADNAWDSDLISLEGYKQCRLSFKTGNITGGNVMMGLSPNPGVSTSYVGIAYAWYNAITSWLIYENGVLILNTSKAVTNNDVALITYDGTYIRYYLNGIGYRTVAGAGQLLFLDSSFYGFNDSKVNSIDFGPSATVPVTDTPQISDGAATDLYVLYDASKTQAGGSGNLVLETLVVPAHDAAHIAIVTATLQVNRTVGSGTATFWVDNLNSGAFSNSPQMDFGAAIDHLAMQFQVSIAAGAVAQTYRLMASIASGTTVSIQAVAFQVEIIKK